MGREVEEDPVGEEDGRVGIFDDEGEAFGAGGRGGPVELRGGIGAIAGEARWDGRTRGEAGAGYRERERGFSANERWSSEKHRETDGGDGGTERAGRAHSVQGTAYRVQGTAIRIQKSQHAAILLGVSVG